MIHIVCNFNYVFFIHVTRYLQSDRQHKSLSYYTNFLNVAAIINMKFNSFTAREPIELTGLILSGFEH